MNISWHFGEILFLFSQLITGKIYESQKFFQHPSYQLQNKNPKKKKWINQINHVQAITYDDTYCNINIGKRMDVFCWTFIRLYPCCFGCLLPIILFFKFNEHLTRTMWDYVGSCNIRSQSEHGAFPKISLLRHS